MPPSGNKVKIGNNLQVLHFDPTPGRNVYDVGAQPQSQLLQSACTLMCRHMYNWNIVDCDVKQQITKHTH